MNEFAQSIALTIQLGRIRHKLSQAKLAKLAGCSQQHISNIENAITGSLTLDILQRILAAVGAELVIQDSREVPCEHKT